jgi:hypothetical protein
VCAASLLSEILAKGSNGLVWFARIIFTCVESHVSKPSEREDMVGKIGVSSKTTSCIGDGKCSVLLSGSARLTGQGHGNAIDYAVCFFTSPPFLPFPRYEVGCHLRNFEILGLSKSCFGER